MISAILNAFSRRGRRIAFERGQRIGWDAGFRAGERTGQVKGFDKGFHKGVSDMLDRVHESARKDREKRG